MNKQIDTLNSFLSFRLGDELFAANVSKVLEILEIPKITKVPRSPSFLRGVINLRGNVLPVIDTRNKFGLPAVDDSVNTCILVLNVSIEGKDLTLGAVVDAVQEVMEIDEASIQALPSVGSKYNSEFIDGMLKLNDEFIMILNLDLVFSSEEVALLDEFAEAQTVTL